MPKPSPSKILFILFGILIVAILVVIGYYFYLKSSGKSALKSERQNKSQAAPSVAKTYVFMFGLLEGEIENWKTLYCASRVYLYPKNSEELTCETATPTNTGITIAKPKGDDLEKSLEGATNIRRNFQIGGLPAVEYYKQSSLDSQRTTKTTALEIEGGHIYIVLHDANKYQEKYNELLDSIRVIK